MRVLLRIAGVLLLLLVLALGAAVYYVDLLAARGIENGASRALGVPAEVGSVHLGLMAGSFRMDGLRVANPPGYDGDFLFHFRHSEFQVPPAALRETTIRVPRVTIEGVDVALERNRGGTNVAQVLDNLKRFESGGKSGGSAGGGRKLVIDEVVIRDVTAWVDVADPTGNVQLDRVEVEVPEIRLRDVGGKGGVSSAQLTNLVVKAILINVAKHGGRLPGAVLGELSRGLAPLDAVRTFGVDAVGRIGEGTGNVLEKGAGKLLEGVGGLLGGKKE